MSENAVCRPRVGRLVQRGRCPSSCPARYRGQQSTRWIFARATNMAAFTRPHRRPCSFDSRAEADNIPIPALGGGAFAYRSEALPERRAADFAIDRPSLARFRIVDACDFTHGRASQRKAAGWISLFLLSAVAGIFLLAGFVKGVIGMGLPTVAIGLLGLMMTPAQAAAILLVPSLRQQYLAIRRWRRRAGFAEAAVADADRHLHRHFFRRDLFAA